MRKTFLTVIICCFAAVLHAQTSNSVVKWGIFASGTCDFETFETGEIKQNFIDVKQEDNNFYWGKDNVYTLYNKKEKHSGFMSFTTYDFIDKYKQRGTLIYQHNRNADWSTKHMFYINYEGNKQGVVYCSREPEVQK